MMGFAGALPILRFANPTARPDAPGRPRPFPDVRDPARRLIEHLDVSGAAQHGAVGLDDQHRRIRECIRDVTMRSPFGITTTGPAPQPGVFCALQATRAAVALSAGDIAVCAFRSSISGRSTPAPLIPCARDATAYAVP